MKFEIKHRWSGSVIFEAEIEANEDTPFSIKLGLAVRKAVEVGARLDGASLDGARLDGARLDGASLVGASLDGASLVGASLDGASLDGASLDGARLDGARLDGASLVGASLVGASLDGASLDGASLVGASLVGATGIAPERVTPLLMLLDQPGKIRAYKLITEKGEGPIYRGIQYEIGKPVSVDDANCNPAIHCGAGVNVATLDWCLKTWRPGYRILIVEFEAADIAAIPTGTDGKFRLHRCDVIAEKVIDPVKLGLVKVGQSEPKADAA